MNILFVHQNFPAQFKNLAPLLAADASNRVVALTMRVDVPHKWRNVDVFSYNLAGIPVANAVSWLSDFEAKTIRAEACYQAAQKLNASGFKPDIIVAHPAWGESLFLKEVWPNAKLAIYCEFFYSETGLDVGFDVEQSLAYPIDLHRFSLKNINNLLHFQIADAGISPTQWQASTFPEVFQKKITVIHDGIDTAVAKPNPNVKLLIANNNTLTKEDEVITFVSRELEPYRGYHILMRALPLLLSKRPNAKVLIVGGNGTAYGQKAAAGTSWAELFAKEAHSQIGEEAWKRVHFLGKISYEHYISVLQLSSAHIYLTYPFVLSWSLMEAMSVGCAVVASDTGPVQELIEDGKTGLLTPFFDVEGLVDRIDCVLSDRKLGQTLGNAARNWIIQRYDLSSVSAPRQVEWIKSLA